MGNNSSHRQGNCQYGGAQLPPEVETMYMDMLPPQDLSNLVQTARYHYNLGKPMLDRKKRYLEKRYEQQQWTPSPLDAAYYKDLIEEAIALGHQSLFRNAVNTWYDALSRDQLVRPRLSRPGRIIYNQTISISMPEHWRDHIKRLATSR